MKTLLAFALCLIALVTNAANPAFSGFRGTGGIICTTNPTLGTVTYGGGGETNFNGEASATNATVMGLVWGKSGVTNLLRSVSAGANIVITNQGTNLIFASTATGGGGGTNYPTPVVGPSVDLGFGVRKFKTWATNSSFTFSFNDTPLNGEEFILVVSNISFSSNITMTTSATVFDPSVATNTTEFMIRSNSATYFTFVNNTNWLLGAIRWELRQTYGKELALLPGTGITFTTNDTASTITVSVTAPPPANVTNSIWVSAGAMTPKLTTTPLVSSFSNSTTIIDTLDYDDASTEDAWFTYQPGNGWAGGVSLSAYYISTNTLNGASNVLWQAAVSKLEANTVPGTFTWSTNILHRFLSSNSVQIAKFPLMSVPAGTADTLLNIRISRLGGDGTDTAAGDAKLTGVRLFTTYTNWIGGYP